MAPPIIVARGLLPLPGNTPPADPPPPSKTPPGPTVAPPTKPSNTPPPSKTATQPAPSKPAPAPSKPAATRPPAAANSGTASNTNSATNTQTTVSNTGLNTNTASGTAPASYTAPPAAPPVAGGGSQTTVNPPSFSIPSINPSASAVGSNTAATPSSGMSTTMIIGIAAGGIVGIALLVAVVSFIMRRCSRRKHQEALGDVFDRQEFKRNSVMVPDDIPSRQSSGRRTGPRPPTMIDRHLNHRPFAQPQHDAYSTGYPPYQQGGYGGGYNQGYGQQPYYAPQPSLNPGDVLPPPGGFGGYDSPAQSPVRDAFSPSSASSSSAPFLNHQLNGPRALTPQSDLSHLGRGQSVTPFQAVQYAEIGRQLQATPTGSGPTTPVEAYARLDRQPSPTHSQQSHPGQLQQPHRYRTAAYQPQRPVSDYDTEDAYGGI